MGLKASLSKPFAKLAVKNVRKWSKNPIETQEAVFLSLIAAARNTTFGKDHGFENIHNYGDFKKAVPVNDYEGLRSYADRVKKGEEDILWPGKPLYLSKTSGTTSGAKYIPITKESIPHQIQAARDAILHYIAETGKADFVNHKMIFLQGSPELDTSGPIPVGRLSGIVAHHVPGYLQRNRLPSLATNIIDVWETKVDAVCDETIKEKMSLISGIPPWVQMYFEKLIEKSGKKSIQEIFPDFSLFIHGGVNYEPYRHTMESLIGKRVDSIELYPASEGFIAYQDSQKEQGMLLLLNSGIFYEFIPTEEYGTKNPTRISLSGVELNQNYVLILNTNAGLWGYNIGDTVRFVSLAPYRIVVTGRIKHFTSAFGEHVIAEEVEKAIAFASEKTGIEVVEFHLAPQTESINGELPYHEWAIEFKEQGIDSTGFAALLNSKMTELNSYYKDLLEGKMLQALKIASIQKDGFQNYMKSKGKLGGQNKLPRLANDRGIIEELKGSRIM
ncbi:GH3 auxin-responsive promoter family protein [Vicingaceae bacterium]|nr:GH3 auxin-responsive promoter family protein [Vicingaceae bacterium]MDB4060788.1 GH3 auxin-responsive promoter family protein [Vicingaceae bacterium]MDC1452408.1 GH3 auxin-responsive promoter family protein [Vicingaceae bacterium]